MISKGVLARIGASYLFRIAPVKSYKVFFSNFDGKGYGDNPKYICEKLLGFSDKYDIVWEVDNLGEPMPEGVRKVKHNSFRALYEAVTSKVWVDNYRKNIWFRKRKNQLYIQTWHAGIGFKKAESAAINSLTSSYIDRAKNDSRMADYFLSGSLWETDKYKKYYWYDGPILKTGVPKQDLLLRVTKVERETLKTKLGIDNELRVALYAPTFRKDMKDCSVYYLEWGKILQSLEKRFGGQWIGAIRLHPGLILNDKVLYNDRVINLSKHSDAQEVLAISDLLITDYSSIIFDYALTGRPALLYAPDLESYKNDRDVFFDLRTLPFPLSEDQSELLENITKFELEKYKKNLESFLHGKCGMYPAGNASSKVGTIIENYMNDRHPLFDESLIADRD